MALYYHRILFYSGFSVLMNCVTDRVQSQCHRTRLTSCCIFSSMPTNSVQALLAQDIPDPTDFAAADLRQLDASFRCTICAEFFDAPISLACGHCFCSLVRNDNILSDVTRLRGASLVHTGTHRERTAMSKLSEICHRSALQGKPSSRRSRLRLESSTVRNCQLVGWLLVHR